jgi:flavin reductase (DIM6/NTAB) family NADH-FMN oxidoreductase RutF
MLVVSNCSVNITEIRHVPVDKNQFRTALSRFASGVTVVTTQDADKRPLGITVSAFCSLSLDPPLVLVCIDRAAYLHDAFQASGVFVVNMLSAEQEALSRLFASREPDKFAGVGYHNGLEGVPVLTDSLATLECRLKQAYEGGDHTIFVGEVEQTNVRDDAHPLLYYRGGYAGLTK